VRACDARGTPHTDSPGERQATLALLLQEPDNQFVASSVRNELLLSIEPALGGVTRGGRIADAVERFALGSLLERNPHRISGGEKQRLALATVWLCDPEVLLLDEPTSYLDPEERERCVAFVRELNGRGASVVWATPGGDDLREAKRVVYLSGGEVRFDGPAGVFEKEARAKGFEVLLSDSDSPTRKEGVVHGAEAISRDRRSASEEIVVSMDTLSFAYDDVEVFRGVSGDIRALETVGIAGKNGSGKSTLLSLLGGILEPTGGKIHRAYTKPVEKRAGRPEQMVFYLFQSPERLFFAETVFEEVAFGLKSLGVGRGDLARRAEEALSCVGLDPRLFLERSPFILSLGEMRRLAFAIAFALRPKLLLLDEPASCLDVSGRRVLGELIDALRSGGSTVVMASHDVPILHRTMDRCLTIENGRLA
jgi:energy-coupling factor transport system ATP-binding protein